jgi:hypothetical protein
MATYYSNDLEWLLIRVCYGPLLPPYAELSLLRFLLRAEEQLVHPQAPCGGPDFLQGAGPSPMRTAHKPTLTNICCRVTSSTSTRTNTRASPTQRCVTVHSAASRKGVNRLRSTSPSTQPQTVPFRFPTARRTHRRTPSHPHARRPRSVRAPVPVARSVSPLAMPSAATAPTSVQ